LIIATDISSDSKIITDLATLINKEISTFDINHDKESQNILEKTLFYDSLKKDEIKELKRKYIMDKQYAFELFGNNEKFIENLFLNGKFLESEICESNHYKPKSLVIVFGNESRGVSPYIKNVSHYKVMIPHFGFNDTSYNLSVSCSMILFYLYTINILPGSFTDFKMARRAEVLAKNILSYVHKIDRNKILGFNAANSDF